MIDDDSGESTEEDEVAGVGRDESELEWLRRFIELLRSLVYFWRRFELDECCKTHQSDFYVPDALPDTQPTASKH